jgi:hypothetical protein
MTLGFRLQQRAKRRRGYPKNCLWTLRYSMFMEYQFPRIFLDLVIFTTIFVGEVGWSALYFGDQTYYSLSPCMDLALRSCLLIN